MERKPWFCQDCRVLMAVIDGHFLRCPTCGTEAWFPWGDKIVQPLPEDRSIVTLSYVPGTVDGKNIDHTGKIKKKKVKFIPFGRVDNLTT